MAERRRRRSVRRPARNSFRWKLLEQREFKPDDLGMGLTKKFYITWQQRMTLLRWGCYVGLCLLALIVQDVILSRLYLFDTRLDLPAAVLLLICVLEGTENGSLFILIASVFYYFSGSSPGPYTVAFLTVGGVLACCFRQKFWHRSRGAVILCAAAALMCYEFATFAIALFQGLTHWGRLSHFLITGALSVVAMLPIYPLAVKIGQIGGRPWKE